MLVSGRSLVLAFSVLLTSTAAVAPAESWNTAAESGEEQPREALDQASGACGGTCAPVLPTPASAPALPMPVAAPPVTTTPAPPAAPSAAPAIASQLAAVGLSSSPTAPPSTLPPATAGAPTGMEGLAQATQAAPEKAAGEPAPARAASLEPRDFSFAIGGRVWITSGYNNWNFGADGINILSELKYRGVDAVIPEVNAELVWKRLVLMGSYGWAGIDQGVLIDDDFLLPDHQGRFSHTRSSVEDKRLYYINGDIGVRLFSRRMFDNPLPAFADFLVGYQYWYEKYVAFGATGFFDGEPNVAPSSLKTLTRDYTWQSVRIGLRYHVPFPLGFGFKGRALFNPWTSAEMRDVHHLRDDLQKNPSAISTATGGFGMELDFGVTYTPWRWVTLEAGLQYWKITYGSGDVVVRSLSSGPLDAKLNEQIIERWGPYFQLQGRF